MAWTDEQCEAHGLVRAVITRGHSMRGNIHGSGRPDPDRPQVMVGIASKTYRPGETVWLDAQDMQRARKNGFVLDPANADDAAVLAVMFVPPPPKDAPTVLKMVPAEAFNLRAVGKR